MPDQAQAHTRTRRSDTRTHLLSLSPTHTQVHDPDLASIKDKNEAELKKEVKKLQKFRDQIKTWYVCWGGGKGARGKARRRQRVCVHPQARHPQAGGAADCG